MRIKSITVDKFKRFSHLEIRGVPQNTKMVVLVGPNGSGKTSLFEAINMWQKIHGFNNHGDQTYYEKKQDDTVESAKSANEPIYKWQQASRQKVSIDFYDMMIDGENVKGHFYFRSAYRNEPDFRFNSLERKQDPTKTLRLDTLIQNDITVSENYQRLIASTLEGVYNTANNKKTVEQFREELIGKIRNSLCNIFPDLNLSSIGDPLANGNFYFEKGSSKNFHYKNLSAGEKSAFDLILDIIIKSHYFFDAVYCIDEPELHMHTELQGSVLRELYNLIPEHSQLWISTHSIGMLQMAEEIENSNRGTIVFLDFSNRNFDDREEIRPAKISRAVREKFYELALGDFAKLMLPKKIIFCEGDPNGNVRRDFDKTIFSFIFADTHPDAFFVSAKSCTELENIETSLGDVMSKLLSNVKIIKIIDRDDRSENEVSELLGKGIKVLKKRSLESYLLDDSTIKKLCDSTNQSDKYNACLEVKDKAIKASTSLPRNNPLDDIKSARGEIYNSLKRILGLTQCGNTADAFLRDTIAPLITPDTEIYKQLEQEIFGNGDNQL
jgi:predicted ATPase